MVICLNFLNFNSLTVNFNPSCSSHHAKKLAKNEIFGEIKFSIRKFSFRGVIQLVTEVQAKFKFKFKFKL